MKIDEKFLLTLDQPGPLAFAVPVLKVFDGDGFLTRIPGGVLTDNLDDHDEVEVGVRLGFIDAPEIDQPGGSAAKGYLSQLIGGKQVWITVLKKMSTQSSMDRYGRLIATAHLLEEHPAQALRQRLNAFQRLFYRNKLLKVARNIELDMVASGWAWVLDNYSPSANYFEALEYAKRSRAGIWANHFNLHPIEFKRRKRRQAFRKPRQTENGATSGCPMTGCDGRLTLRTGKYGRFYGCSNFPDCRYTRKGI